MWRGDQRVVESGIWYVVENNVGYVESEERKKTYKNQWNRATCPHFKSFWELRKMRWNLKLGKTIMEISIVFPLLFYSLISYHLKLTSNKANLTNWPLKINPNFAKIACPDLQTLIHLKKRIFKPLMILAISRPKMTQIIVVFYWEMMQQLNRMSSPTKRDEREWILCEKGIGKMISLHLGLIGERGVGYC